MLLRAVGLTHLLLVGILVGCTASPQAADEQSGAITGGSEKAKSNPQPLPEIAYRGGQVMTQIRLVTVTSNGDDFQTDLERFGDVVGQTSWWETVRDGYCDDQQRCVGSLASSETDHVRLDPAKFDAEYTDAYDTSAPSSLKAWLSSQLGRGVLPAPSEGALYVIYLPASSKVQIDGTVTCGGSLEGYHAWHTFEGTPFVYAVVSRCEDNSQVDLVTSLASHEIFEAATNPIFEPKEGYNDYADDAWDLFGGGETGDRCEKDWQAPAKRDVVEQGFTFQREFSNKAAKAGHDPCVPAPPPSEVPYFNVKPNDGDLVSMSVGDHVSLAVTAISDAPVGAFAFRAYEATRELGRGDDVLDVTQDAKSLAPGDTTSVKVSLKSAPTGDSAVLFLEATLKTQGGELVRKWPVAISAK